MNARPEFTRAEQVSDIAADINRGSQPFKPIGRYAPLPNPNAWTYEDERAAANQGWFIHPIGLKQICAIKGDVPWPRLHWSCNEAAWAFVGARALMGDELACRALLYIAERCGVMGQARYGMRNNG